MRNRNCQLKSCYDAQKENKSPKHKKEVYNDDMATTSNPAQDRPSLEQCIAIRDAEFVGYSPIPLIWRTLSDEEADKEWYDISKTTHTFKLENREEVAKANGHPDVTWEICLVSFGWNKDKSAATCYLS